MTSLALLFTFAAIGISETAYLVRTRIGGEHLVCPIGGGCEAVLHSKYNRTLFVPNDIAGLLLYIVIAKIAALLVIGVEPTHLWTTLLQMLVGIASFASLVFTYLQWKVIKAWCFWCVMSAITIWSMALILIMSPVF